jgi:hypothetical protein
MSVREEFTLCELLEFSEFICSLLNPVMLYNIKLLNHNEYRIGQYVEEMVVAQFQELSWHLPGGTENYKQLRQEYQCPG